MNNSTIAINKKASFDYELIKEYDAGIVLNGWEIKSLRNKKVTIKDSFIIFKKHEPYILNLHIAPFIYSNNNFINMNPERTRKLLLNKNEIKSIEKDIKLEKVIVIPTKLFFRNNLVKIKIYTAKAKRKFDKRESIKKRDLERDLNTKFKYKN